MDGMTPVDPDTLKHLNNSIVFQSSREITVCRESSAGSPNDHANSPPILYVLFIATHKFVGQQSWGCDRRWRFLEIMN